MGVGVGSPKTLPKVSVKTGTIKSLDEGQVNVNVVFFDQTIPISLNSRLCSRYHRRSIMAFRQHRIQYKIINIKINSKGTG